MDKKNEKTSLDKATEDYKESIGIIIGIAFAIAVLFGIPHYFIERNNCTHGAPTSKQAMQYHNGKVNMNSSEYTIAGLVCKKYNTSYGMKLVFAYFVIGFLGTSGVYLAIKNNKYAKKTNKKKI